MKRVLGFLILCCYFGIIGFSGTSYAAQVSEVEIPDDDCPDGSNFDQMKPGEVLIDDTDNMDRTLIDQSYTREYNYQRSSVPISDSRLSNLHGRQGLKTLAFYLQQNFNHRKGASKTAHGVIATGYGDCWGLSDFAVEVLTKNGYTVKLVQGRSSQSNAHRWLEVQLEDGSWTTFDPSLVTKKYHYKPYWYRCAQKNQVLGVYCP
ncbi:transglutaminase domain-containing protein [Methanobacterium congolense]|uniref:Transglutaminase-like domain-containing protein n=1 Tax=Methanobacterium congolense TaxID=118062 RepID=A0A1D3L2S4_9EURY|nr:transglutaminase domain-containing protein [Methanobacterium congolense]SCG85964.1 putative protein [Methanobacterium congolense]